MLTGMQKVEATHAYVGRCKCGNIVAAVVDERDTPKHRRLVARDVAGFVRDGLSVAHESLNPPLKMAHCACE